MNINTILLIAAAGAAYMIFKSKTGSANTVNNLGTAINGISEIFTGATGNQAGAGWRYFSDGTSIDPQGNYYMNGVEVWAK
jgi:hypothetical protein